MKQVHFKRIISMLVTVAMFMTMVPTAFASVEQFVDFPTGWSKEAMTFSVDNGLINGKSATRIEPQANLTRAEMATIINRAFGAEVTCDISQYTDVKTNDWFYTEMQKAVNMQTFQGDGNGKLRPNDSITREEVMTVLARAIVLESSDYSSINKFSDNSAISSWAKPFVSALIAGGYVDGYEDGTVRPGAKITREEFAQLMYNIFKTYFTTQGTYNSVTNSDCVMINEGGITLSDVTIDGDLVLGDGVSTGGGIFLTNVTIKGRLVARGGVIKLKNVTTGGGVVVKNVNGVTHFNNYRTESVFKGVIEHTHTTYLTAITGGGSVEKYDVIFYNGVDEDASEAYVGEISVASGSTISATTYEKLYSDKGIDFEDMALEGYSDPDEGYTHMIEPELRYKDSDGNWQVFDENTKVTSDMKVYCTFKYIQLVIDGSFMGIDLDNVSLYTYYESDTRFMDSLKDAMTISKKPIENGIKSREANILKQLADKTGLIDYDGNVLIKSFGLRIAEIIDQDEICAAIEDYIKQLLDTDIEKALNIIKLEYIINLIGADKFNGNSDIEVNDVVEYINSLNDTDYNKFRTDFAKRVIEIESELIDSFSNKDTFIINNNTLPIAIAVADEVRSFETDAIIARLRAKGYGAFIDVCGEKEFGEMFIQSQKEYSDGVSSLVYELDNNPSLNKTYTTKMSVRLNLAEILETLYAKIKAKLLEKLAGNDYYEDNDYLVEFIEQDLMNVMFAEETNTESGYKIRTIMEYYDIALENLILIDKALLWYGEIDETDYDNMRSEYAQDVVAMLAQMYEILESIQDGTEVIAGYNLDDIMSKLSSISDMIDNLGSDTLGGLGQDIKLMIEDINEELDTLEKTGETSLGFTADELKAINDKLSRAADAFGKKDYTTANEYLADVTATVLNQLVEIAKEIDANGTINGKDFEDKILHIPFINKLYNRYSTVFDSFIDKLANGTYAKEYTKEDILKNMNTNRIEQIIIGHDTDDRFTIDSAVDLIIPYIEDYKVENPDHADSEYIIDQYQKTGTDNNITLRRYLY